MIIHIAWGTDAEKYRWSEIGEFFRLREIYFQAVRTVNQFEQSSPDSGKFWALITTDYNNVRINVNDSDVDNKHVAEFLLRYG